MSLTLGCLIEAAGWVVRELVYEVTKAVEMGEHGMFYFSSTIPIHPGKWCETPFTYLFLSMFVCCQLPTKKVEMVRVVDIKHLLTRAEWKRNQIIKMIIVQ